MRHGELNKYYISFMISDSSHKPLKMFPYRYKHKVEKFKIK